MELVGWVRNDPDGAVIEVEGPHGAPEVFVQRLPRELPRLAQGHAPASAAIVACPILWCGDWRRAMAASFTPGSSTLTCRCPMAWRH